VKVNGRFGGTGRKQGSACCLLILFFTWLTIRPWKWKRYVTPRHRLTFAGLPDFISQKMELFKERFLIFPERSTITAYRIFAEKASHFA
jgi:hypothetical protein